MPKYLATFRTDADYAERVFRARPPDAAGRRRSRARPALSARLPVVVGLIANLARGGVHADI
jgi:hypothetical protein